MYISDFSFYKPKTIEEACTLLKTHTNPALLAGGTDLFIEMKQGLRHHDHIISLNLIDELKTINEHDDELLIGALVTHNQIIKSKVIQSKFIAMAEAASKIGSEQIRNAGTIGGNLCTGASCCDSAPVLMALNATVEIMNEKGLRDVLVKELFRDHRETIIDGQEILTKIKIPFPDKGIGVSFQKFGLRDAAAISVVSASVSVTAKDNKCVDATVVIGAVGPTPIISIKSGDIIKGEKMTDLVADTEVISKAGQAAADDALPIGDIRGSADYRRKLTNTLTQRAIIEAVERAVSN